MLNRSEILMKRAIRQHRDQQRQRSLAAGATPVPDSKGGLVKHWGGTPTLLPAGGWFFGIWQHVLHT